MRKPFARWLIAILFFCAPTELFKPLRQDPVTFRVTSMMSGVFADITKQDYAMRELPGLWDTLSAGAAKFCAKYGPNRIPPKDIRSKFIREDFFSGRIHSNRIETDFNKVMFGCRNFFQMNDVFPDADFALVAKMFPDERFDCYTVGLMQAYIMSSILHCETLTVVDINWQVLQAHFDLFQKLRLNTSKAKNIEEIAGAVRLSYVANMGSAEAKYHRQPAKFTDLCRNLVLDMCKNRLKDLIEKNALPPRLEIQLSHLKDADYHRTRNLNKVIFFSNALDAFYTTFKEFNFLMGNLNNSITGENRALVIHHVGGNKTFGLYQLTKGLKQPKVTVLCKDEYRKANFSDVTYASYFEIVWGYPKVPACQSLLKTY